MDFKMGDGSTLRIMKTGENQSCGSGQRTVCFVWRRNIHGEDYATVHNLTVDDKLTVAGDGLYHLWNRDIS